MILLKSNEELIKDYIKKYETKGYTDQQIKKALLSSGIEKKVVEKYLRKGTYKKLLWIVPLTLLGIFLVLMFIFWLTEYVLV